MVYSFRHLPLIAAVLMTAPLAAQETVKPAPPPTVAVPVAAAPTATAPAARPEIKVTATNPDLKDPDVVVCKTETNTGSRIASTKRCQTRRQWAEQAREVQKMIVDKPSPSAGSN